MKRPQCPSNQLSYPPHECTMPRVRAMLNDAKPVFPSWLTNFHKSYVTTWKSSLSARSISSHQISNSANTRRTDKYRSTELICHDSRMRHHASCQTQSIECEWDQAPPINTDLKWTYLCHMHLMHYSIISLLKMWSGCHYVHEPWTDCSDDSEKSIEQSD